MSIYRTIHVARHYIPQDRLARATIEDDVILFSYRAWHIHPALLAGVSELSQDIAWSGILDLEVDHTPEAPPIMAWFEPGNLAIPMRPRVGGASGNLPPFFEIQCRADMIDPALVREINEKVLPWVCSFLVPVSVAQS